MTASATDPGLTDSRRPLATWPQTAPFSRAPLQVSTLMWTVVATAAGLAAVGWVFYGPVVLLQVIAGLVVAAATEGLCSWLAERFSMASFAHSLGLGLIVVLMLPPAGTWQHGLAATGIAVAAALGIGKWLMGGLGHYPWHPAIVGVIALYMLWPTAVAPQRWPLLAQGHVLTGGAVTGSMQEIPVLPARSQAETSYQAVGFTLPQAETVFRRVTAQPADGVDGGAGRASIDRNSSSADQPLATAVRDLLPNGWDMLIGAVPGPIGQGSTLAVVAAGLVLIWRGYLRWTVPLAGLTGAVVAAAVLPAGEAGWLPVRYVVAGQAVGLIWTGYQVLLGTTVFAVVVLAGETVTSPLTRRGQVVYGFGVGALTVALRWWPIAVLSGYWAVLAMNSLVPVIDWLDRRWRIVRGG